MPGSRIVSADPAALDAELRALHGARGDAAAAVRLSVLHEAAADLAEGAAARFHLTHAWVHALEAGDEDRSARVERLLRDAGGLGLP